MVEIDFMRKYFNVDNLITNNCLFCLWFYWVDPNYHTNIKCNGQWADKSMVFFSFQFIKWYYNIYVRWQNVDLNIIWKCNVLANKCEHESFANISVHSRITTIQWIMSTHYFISFYYPMVMMSAFVLVCEYV